MNSGRRAAGFFWIVFACIMCGCPGPRQPASSPAQPPVTGSREASEKVSMPVAATDWHRWRGPNANGLSPETNWNPVFPPNGPKQLWKQNVGIGFASISVGGGRVYTMGHQNKQDTVYCFDLQSGKEIWRHSYPAELDPKYYEGGPSATPTIDGNVVYTLGKMGDFFCLDAARGTVIWSKNISQELGAEIPTWGYAGSVLIEGNLAIVNVGTFGTALDKNTGKVIWQTGKDASGYATPVPFNMDGQQALAIFAANYIVGIKTSEGTLLWRHPWNTDYDVNAADPIVWDNKVFISSGYGTGCALVQFAPGKPKQLWRNKEMHNQVNSCVLVDGHIYGIDGQTDARDPKLKCIDWNTGETKWAEPISGTGSLIAADHKLIVLSGKGELIIAEATPAAFKEISRAQVIGARCWSPPALSNGRLLCRNSQGTVICLDLGK